MMRYKLFFLFFITSIFCCQSGDEKYIRDLQISYRDISAGYFGADQKLFLVHSSCKEFPKEIVVFVHGSPGSWRDYKKFILDETLRNKYCLVTLDRPGFGNSMVDMSMPDIEKQADLIFEAMQDFRRQFSKLKEGTVFVGHSYGGPIIASIAKTRSSKFDQFIFISSPIDPSLEEIRWYNRIASYSLIRFLLSKEMNHSNEEMMPLREQLSGLVKDWKSQAKQFIVLHGDHDMLVPIENVKFFKNLLILGNKLTKTIVIEDENHFIPWTQHDLVVKSIMELEK